MTKIEEIFSIEIMFHATRETPFFSNPFAEELHPIDGAPVFPENTVFEILPWFKSLLSL
jgi:hypothetical protein